MPLSLRSLTRRARIVSATSVAVLASGALIAASAAGAQGGSAAKAVPTAGKGASASIVLNGVNDVTTLLKGIPQAGAWLGSAAAPIQMVVFADLQCPFCKQYDTEVNPTVIRNYVRTGKVRLFFAGMHFIGSDSTRGLKAAAAAADQNRLWYVVSLLYINQGVENKGWLSEKMLAAVAKATPGLDVKKFDAARKGKGIDGRMTSWDNLAQSAGVNSTPSFFVGTPGKLSPFVPSALSPAPFKTALDRLIKAK
jgi:protein-disulfide isomerase